MAELPAFNQEAAFDADVAPLVTQLARACSRLGLPCFVSVCFASEDHPAAFRTATINLPRITKTAAGRLTVIDFEPFDHFASLLDNAAAASDLMDDAEETPQ